MDNITPHSTDAEQGLLASCLLENGGDILSDCLAAKISADYFYKTPHQIIFQALSDLYAVGVPPDEILLANKLGDTGNLETIGGHAYIYELTNKIQTTVHAKHWMEIVREKHFLRQLIRTSQWTVEQAHGAGRGSVAELLNNVESEFLKIQGDTTADTCSQVTPSVDAACVMFTKALARRGEVSGVPSGFTDLDKITGGFHPAEMIVVAARPSQGKTAIAMNIAENAVLPLPRENRQPTTTLVFSLEMTAEQLMYRMMCSVARADMRKIADGFCDRQAEVINSARAIKASPLYVNPSSSLGIMEIRANARRFHKKNKLGLVIIDYMQLIVSPDGKDSREQEVATVSRGIKAMAKELNIPVVVLCQLNRESEKEKRAPRLSDLRESGCITGDSIIYGRNLRSRIDKLSIDTDDGLGVFSCSVNNSSVNSPARKVWKTGDKPVSRMTLSTGHTICATENHRFYCANGRWIPLGELSSGDMIAIPLSPKLPTKATISTAEARLMGLLISNGCTIPRHSIQITMNKNDGDLADMAMKDCETIFPGELRPYISSGEHISRPNAKWLNVFLPSKRTPSKRKRSVLVDWLITHGMYGKRASEKSIPDTMFNQPPEIISQFLSALFSGDGTCGIYRDGKNPKKNRYSVASYSSCSRELIDGVQWLLQCLGIVSGVSEVNCRGFRSYILSVYSRDNKLRFASEVGFIGKRKDATMQGVLDAMMAAPMGYEKYKRVKDVAFVPIRKIEQIGIMPVYDMEVHDTHNFVANGILVHNSIEQDADVVLLLAKARDIEETDDQIAVRRDLIIAKNRNGPVGSVPLIFNKRLCRFENYTGHFGG